MNKKTVIAFFALAIIGFGAYYFYNHFLYKEARNISTEKASFTIKSSDFFKEYRANPTKADSKYLNKTIKISGIVTEVSDSTLTIDQKIFCQMTQKAASNLLNKSISIKGRCIGYDDLFEQVKFDQCNSNH